MKNALRSSSYLLVVLIAWYAISALIDRNWVFPDPLAVVSRLGSLLGEASVWNAIGATMLRLLLALGLSFFLGSALGVWAGLNRTVSFLTQPAATVFRTIPVVSIIVLVLLIFGFRAAPYVITFLMLMPISYQAAKEGVASVDSELLDVYRLEDNHPFRMAIHCYLPLMAGYLKTALLQSAGLGIKVLVMAEYLAQTPDSIGEQLYLSRVNIEIDAVFAWTLLLIAIALVFERLIAASGAWKNTAVAPQKRRSERD